MTRTEEGGDQLAMYEYIRRTKPASTVRAGLGFKSSTLSPDAQITGFQLTSVNLDILICFT